MNYPAIPLITVDPYFSVWSQYNFDKHSTAEVNTFHWTGSPQSVLGIVEIDGKNYRFLGTGKDECLVQKSVKVTALSTYIVYEGGGIRLNTKYTTPVMANNLYLSSRPVSYLYINFENIDGAEHKVNVRMSVSEEMVLNKKGDSPVDISDVSGKNIATAKMGNTVQKVLNRSGDDVRIDWGYFYLSVKDGGRVYSEKHDDMSWVVAQKSLNNDALFLFAYDDIDSIVYFGDNLKAYWKEKTPDILSAIEEAADEYEVLIKKCDAFSDDLTSTATEKGGEHYAELLSLAYRQVMAGHKLVKDKDGNNLYISKECFSNGCAATVDVTYPSAPMFIYYNTELLKGMLRPVFRYAHSDVWNFDFAPHDVGQYPLVNGQVYGENRLEFQMPVEECANMIIATDAICRKDADYTFAEKEFEMLKTWSEYLLKYGEDPQNQLCTDDFAGHLAHNCNLSIKAIMGITGFADILENLGKKEQAEEYLNKAKEFAASFLDRARNSDGSYRLAFDRPDTFSLKYNAVWDKVWKTNIFPDEFYKNEIIRYKKEALPYGVPMDSREKYTKSDWQLWAACLSDNREDFDFLLGLMYKAYNTTRDFVPLTDWYFADTAQMRAFRHRTVQGGLFIKLLID